MKKQLLLLITLLLSVGSFAQCNYSFLLKDSFGDGWNGARMTVKQNGVTVATLGATFTNGTQITVQVPLQNNVPFELFWEIGGTFQGEVGVSVINPFNQTLYTKPSGTGLPNANIALFSAMANCDQPACMPPTTLGVNNIDLTSADITWANPSGGSQWEVMLLPLGSPAPLPAQAGNFASTNSFTATGLTCSTVYSAYVRSVCPGSNLSDWVGPVTFQTLSCNPQPGSVCNYSFLMKDSAGDGWNGNTMSIKQNGIIVATIGSAFTSGTEATVQVPLQNNVAFQLFWNLGGSSPNQVGVSVINPFNQTLYTKAFGSGTPNANTALFSGMTNCLFPACQVPTTLGVSSVAGTSANITWANPSGGASQFEVLVLPATAPAPVSTQAGFITTTNSFTATGLICATAYNVFVKSVCQESNSSNWVGPFAFQTLNCTPQSSSLCLSATSLCSALNGVFVNTVGSPNQGTMGCLTTTPNATWFSFSTATTGTVSLQITENTNFDLNSNPIGTGLDADFILYGPYASPITSCSAELIPSKILACSYSISAVENASFTVTQAGAYYYLMVTNFSNISGFIKISQTAGTASLDCQGFRLNAFLDVNANGVNDLGDVAFPHGQFVYEKNNDGIVHNVVSTNGSFNIFDSNPASTYDFGYQIHSDYSPYFTLATSSFNDVSMTVPGMTNSINFPIAVSTVYNDVAVNVVSMGSPRPGFSYKNKILYTNKGNQAIANGSLLFTKDSAVTIATISQSGTVATPTGFSYTFTDLQPFETRTIEVTMMVPTIPTVQLGNLLTNSASVAISATDEMPANNNAALTQVIIGSYDPNDINESHGEEILHSSFTSDDYLYYTIRFENTGSASAMNVKVNNILNAKLDENSIKVVGSSANLIMDRVGNIVNWDFKNIMLVSAAKGYVVYKIKPKPGYAVGDIIPNNASIYFDFNPAIVTNTFNTEFVAQLGVEEFENASFSFYPNPTKDIVTVSLKNEQDVISNIAVYNLLGKIVFDKKFSGTTLETINLSNFSKGLYLIEVTTQSNLKVIKKLIVE
ncbi:DUF7619 domain-containing protein [Flavobacterium sp.]|uniref:T9SS type A sorting domain-containing protein n=1 Tax=Flavobacterium sp. TaxID=239 RepID=UPI003D6B8640